MEVFGLVSIGYDIIHSSNIKWWSRAIIKRLSILCIIILSRNKVWWPFVWWIGYHQHKWWYRSKYDNEGDIDDYLSSEMDTGGDMDELNHIRNDE